jgi:hypothetical protein
MRIPLSDRLCSQYTFNKGLSGMTLPSVKMRPIA